MKLNVFCLKIFSRECSVFAIVEIWRVCVDELVLKKKLHFDFSGQPSKDIV